MRLCLLIWVFVLGLCGIANVSAQSADSLLAQLKRHSRADTMRVNLLYDYAWEIADADTDAAERYFEEALALAQNLQYDKGIANALNGLGVVAEIRGDYDQASRQYRQAAQMRENLGDVRGAAGIYSNLGMALSFSGHQREAAEQLQRSLELYESIRDTVKIIQTLSNMGEAYQNARFYEPALEKIQEARILLEYRGDSLGLSKIYTRLGHIRFELDMYPQALEWYQKSLRIRLRHDDEVGIAAGLEDMANALDETERSDTAMVIYASVLNTYRTHNDLPGQARVLSSMADALKHLDRNKEALETARQSESLYTEMRDSIGLMTALNIINDVLFRLGRVGESLAYIDRYHEVALAFGDQKFLLGAYKDYARGYAALGDYRRAYEYRVKYDELRYRLLDEKRTELFEQRDAAFTDAKRKKELEEQQRALERQQLIIEKARIRTWALVGGAVGLALIALLLFNRARTRARTNRELSAKNAAIERERQRADQLLKNILPEATAEELKTYNRVQPVRYESVSVIFTDFVGFTYLAESMSPEELVAELDECFRMMDEIVVRCGLEKIKTLGDGYMCAGGLPTPNASHPYDAVVAALEMQTALTARMKAKTALGKAVFTMRVGIHTGPVVAGVVGSRKFAYDIWGDTVNTAARMEQSGEPGKVNISETTWRLVKDRFQCVYRGHVKAKNKGELAMYFVEGSVNGGMT
mgnify:CR=1 FL=1